MKSICLNKKVYKIYWDFENVGFLGISYRDFLSIFMVFRNSRGFFVVLYHRGCYFLLMPTSLIIVHRQNELRNKLRSLISKSKYYLTLDVHCKFFFSLCFILLNLRFKNVSGVLHNNIMSI